MGDISSTGGGACQGCGKETSVVYEEVLLCGSCFYIASLTSLRRASRTRARNGTDRASETASMIASVVASMSDGESHGS